MFPSNSRKHGYILLVPVTGVEPVRYHYHRILSPARLPIPSHRQKIRTKINSDLTFAILAQKVYFVKRENKKFRCVPEVCDNYSVNECGRSSESINVCSSLFSSSSMTFISGENSESTCLQIPHGNVKP